MCVTICVCVCLPVHGSSSLSVTGSGTHDPTQCNRKAAAAPESLHSPSKKIPLRVSETLQRERGSGRRRWMEKWYGVGWDGGAGGRGGGRGDEGFLISDKAPQAGYELEL